MHNHTKNELPLNEAEIFLQEKYVRMMRHARPNMDEFDDVYGKDKIDRDKEALLRKQKSYNEADKHERAEILEAVLMDQIESSEWFGEGVATTASSEYDDEFHGVDFVVEWDMGEDKDVIRLAVDVTTSKDRDVIREKWRRIVEPLKNKGKLSDLEYFESGVDHSKDVASMPHVILGIDADNFDEVAKEIKELIDNKQTDQLGEHFLKYDLLNSAVEQLEYFNTIISDSGDGVRKEIQEVINQIKSVQKNKRPPKRLGSRNNVYTDLKDIISEAV